MRTFLEVWKKRKAWAPPKDTPDRSVLAWLRLERFLLARHRLTDEADTCLNVHEGPLHNRGQLLRADMPGRPNAGAQPSPGFPRLRRGSQARRRDRAHPTRRTVHLYSCFHLRPSRIGVGGQGVDDDGNRGSATGLDPLGTPPRGSHRKARRRGRICEGGPEPGHTYVEADVEVGTPEAGPRGGAA